MICPRVRASRRVTCSFCGGVTRCHPRLIRSSVHHPSTTTHDDASAGCAVTPVHPRTEAPKKLAAGERDAAFPLSPTSRPPPPRVHPLVTSYPLGAGAMGYVDIANTTPTLSSTDPTEVAMECDASPPSRVISYISKQF